MVSEARLERYSTMKKGTFRGDVTDGRMNTSMKYPLSLVTFCIAGALVPHATGATTVSGNVSGVWTTNGSPYAMIANCIVPADQSLTIQPGVTVIGGPGTLLGVYGRLMAQGTPERWITFRGANASNRWATVFVYSTPANPLVVSYCQFSDASEVA